MGGISRKGESTRMEVQNTKQFHDGSSRMGGSARIEVQNVKQFQDERKFQDRSSECEAVPGWKFQDGMSGCEAVPGWEEVPG
jgi:hypothetical protein